MGPRGFTLVEIMVALGVMSIGALGVMQMAQIQGNIQVDAKTALGTAQITNIIQRHLSTSSGCEATFGAGSPFANANFADGMNVGRIATANGDTLARQGEELYPDIAIDRASIPSVLVDNITIRDVQQDVSPPPAPVVRTFSFFLDIQLDRISAVGEAPTDKQRTVRLPFPIQIRKEAGSMVHDTCVTEGVLATDTALSELCDAITGNLGGAYDAAARTCNLVDFGSFPLGAINQTNSNMIVTSIQYFHDAFEAFINTVMNANFVLDGESTDIAGLKTFAAPNGMLLESDGSVAGAPDDAIRVDDVTQAVLGGFRCTGSGIGFISNTNDFVCQDLDCGNPNEYLRGFTSGGIKICSPVLENPGASCPGGGGTLNVDTVTGAVRLDC